MRFLFTLFLAVGMGATAVAKPIDWSSDLGIGRLERSKAKVDFFPLANHFESQTNKFLCGPTSAVIVLNTLRVGGKDLPQDKTTFDERFNEHLPKDFDPRFQKYTQKNFFLEGSDMKTPAQVSGEKISGEADYGLQLKQLATALAAHDLKVTAFVVDDKADEAKIKASLVKNLKTRGDYVLVNYARKSLEQKGGGHISPLGAYDEVSDSFLVMDVNPNKAPWVWVSTHELIEAMRTKDTVENRGYVLVSEGKVATK